MSGSILQRPCVVLAVLGHALQVWSAELVSGPFAEAITPTNTLIRWTTDVATGSRVYFGPEPGQMSRRGIEVWGFTSVWP